MANGELLPFCELLFSNTTSTQNQTALGTSTASDKTFMLRAPEDLDFSVSAEGDRETVKTAKLHLWNMSTETLSKLKRGTLVDVVLGYRDGVRGTVHNGYVYWVDGGEVNGADVETVVYCRDLTDRNRSTSIKATFVDSFIEDIVRDLLSAARIPIGRIDATNVRLANYTSGTKSLDEDLRDLTNEAAKQTGERWLLHFRNSQCVFLRESTGFNTAIVLESSTGLTRVELVLDDITNPDNADEKRADFDLEGIQQGEAPMDPTKLQKKKIRFESTMKPDIYPDALVYVKSAKATGYYRVESFEHAYEPNGQSKTSGTASPQIQLAGLAPPAVA